MAMAALAFKKSMPKPYAYCGHFYHRFLFSFRTPAVKITVCTGILNKYITIQNTCPCFERFIYCEGRNEPKISPNALLGDALLMPNRIYNTAITPCVVTQTDKKDRKKVTLCIFHETAGCFFHYFLNLYSHQLAMPLNLLFRLNRSPQLSMESLIAF